MNRLPELALELVHRNVAVIAVAGSTPAVLAAKSATTTIPIVFSIAQDPVKLGIVSSLNRPEGNATGVNFFVAELGAKRLGLLRELLPGAMRVAVLVNPTDVSSQITTKDTQEAARALGLQLSVLSASTGQEIEEAFATIGRERPDALFVGPDIFFNSRKVQLAILAARYGIPTAFVVRDYVEAGGLMSYGTNINDAYRQVGVYTGRILKGEKPKDLPILQPSKFELVINLRTARALGVQVPYILLIAEDLSIVMSASPFRVRRKRAPVPIRIVTAPSRRQYQRPCPCHATIITTPIAVSISSSAIASMLGPHRHGATCHYVALASSIASENLA
jgi:putative ABC transport system substrate-binding protein